MGVMVEDVGLKTQRLDGGEVKGSAIRSSI
jgi:hypothetical protein